MNAESYRFKQRLSKETLGVAMPWVCNYPRKLRL